MTDKVKPKLVALSLENLHPDIRAQYDAPDKAKPLQTIPGIQRRTMIACLEAAIAMHAMGEAYWDKPLAISKLAGVSLATVERLQTFPQWTQGLILRGLMPSADAPLSGEQLRALNCLTDATRHKSFEARLKAAGIDPYKWNIWLNQPVFRAAHDKIAHEMFVKSQAQIDMQLASGALSGKLDFIKYYNEVSGRHDPNRRAHADVQTLLNIVSDVILRNVKDPDLLKTLSDELSAAVAVQIK